MSTADSTGQDTPENPTENVSEGLATWLENLGLAEHLSDAGLPSYVRNEDGAAQWTDPATDEPMSDDQLRALDAMLRGQGDEPEHAVPLKLVQLARQAKVRGELATTPSFSYESLADLRDESVNATRFFVHKAAEQHRVLLVTTGETLLIPAFQFDAAGQERADLAEILPPLLAAGMDPWRAWGWLAQPAGLLGGLVPLEAVADPETADIVRHAAARLAAKTAAEAPAKASVGKRSVCH